MFREAIPENKNIVNEILTKIINYIFYDFRKKLFFLMSVRSSSFLSLVCCYLVSFSFLSAWHNL